MNERELMLEYIANTLLIEKLHREFGDKLKDEPDNLNDLVLIDMVVLQYRSLDERNARIMDHLLKNQKNIKIMRRYTHNFSLDPQQNGYSTLSPGCANTKILPFVKNYRGVDFIKCFKSLINKTILEKYKEQKLKENNK